MHRILGVHLLVVFVCRQPPECRMCVCGGGGGGHCIFQLTVCSPVFPAASATRVNSPGTGMLRGNVSTGLTPAPKMPFKYRFGLVMGVRQARSCLPGRREGLQKGSVDDESQEASDAAGFH